MSGKKDQRSRVHSSQALIARLSSMRLSRKPATPREAASSKCSYDEQRAKIQRGLDELTQITTKEAYERAITSGIIFSNEGFRARVKVGSTTLHYTHSDLFQQLQIVLDYIFPTFIGVPRNKKGRSRRPTSKKVPPDRDLRILELETLLERREMQFLDLIKQIKELGGEPEHEW